MVFPHSQVVGFYIEGKPLTLVLRNDATFAKVGAKVTGNVQSRLTLIPFDFTSISF